jgi:hypothetical protein
MDQKNTQEHELVKSVHERLNLIEEIRFFNNAQSSEDDPESWKIALNLTHIVGSAEKIKFAMEKIPNSSLDNCLSYLTEIGVEVRHIQWHIRNMEYFGKCDFSV